MTTLAENVVRLTGLPQYCAACRNQDSAVRHVDFDAAVDRGYGDGPVPVSMDDLIICERCLREAALLVDMVDGEELKAELDRMEKRLAAEKYRADSNEKYAGQLEDAFDARPNGVNAPRKRGRPLKED